MVEIQKNNMPKQNAYSDLQTSLENILHNNAWVDRPSNPRKIKVWENFKRAQIMKDFYQTMEHFVLAATKK